MKKAKIILLLLMTSTLMVACGSEVSNESNADTERGDNGYSTESSIAGEKGQIVETEGTEIALWEKYPIMPGSTWEYMVDDRTTIFANVVYNEDGSVSVQGFAYTDNELAEEYLIDKTLYTEDGIYYTTEDGNFDMSVAYSDSVEFVDWENGLFEGTFSLVADENTDDIIYYFTEATDMVNFARDSSNLNVPVTFEANYVKVDDINPEYYWVQMIDHEYCLSIMLVGENDEMFFRGDDIRVTGSIVQVAKTGELKVEFTSIELLQ